MQGRVEPRVFTASFEFVGAIAKKHFNPIKHKDSEVNETGYACAALC